MNTKPYCHHLNIEDLTRIMGGGSPAEVLPLICHEDDYFVESS